MFGSLQLLHSSSSKRCYLHIKSTYKFTLKRYLSHTEKSGHLVERRNAPERDSGKAKCSGQVVSGSKDRGLWQIGHLPVKEGNRMKLSTL